MEPSEKGRLIMTAKMLQERFDRNLSNPCLPHLFTALLNILATREEHDRKADTGEKTETERAPTPWLCTLNNLGVVEKRLETQHGRISVGSMSLGLRLRHCM